MNPEEFLIVANELRRRGEPAYRRSAINRAYYASFLTARAYVNNIMRKNVSGSKSTHGEVIQCLAESNDSKIKILAGKLNEMRRYRVTADYEMNDATPEKQVNVNYVVTRAEKFVKTISDKTKSASS